MSAISLAYVGLGVADVPAWTQFGVDILDLEDTGSQADGSHLLRLDDHAWRIALHPDPVNDIVYSGYSVEGADAVSRIADAFADESVGLREMTAAQRQARHCKGGIILTDPDGLSIEVVHGLEGAATYKSGYGSQFVTGTLGLGHIVLSASNIDRTLAFYAKLGFQISDYIEFTMGPAGRVRLVFLHCNERHHTLAFIPLPIPQRLNHVMLEVTSIDTVLRGYYRALDARIPITRHIGRHTNDKMLSFYVQTPAGFSVEYGCDGIHVRDDWQIREYDAISIWGHTESAA